MPPSPGVYRFRNAAGDVIYVGKAKSLRARVRSYFHDKGPPDPKKEALVSKIASLDLVVTDSELEALLLENNLIKEHAPRYNIRLKDDKSYPSIVITNEPFPRVFPTRVIRRDGSRYYGPYSDVKAMHLMLRTIRGIFPIRSCDFLLDDDVIGKRKVKLCLDYHIQRCEGPCEGLVSQAEYNAHIRQVELLLKGKTRGLRQDLEQEMQRCAEALEFEKAAACRNRILALQKFEDRQKVAAADFGDRDIVTVASAGSDAVGVVFRVRDGKIVGKQHYTFTGADYEADDEILSHLLQRHYAATLDIPPEILLPADLDAVDAVTAWIAERASMSVDIVVPKIGDKVKLVRMCQANAKYLLDEILLQKFKTDEFIPKSVQFLQRDLRLAVTPRRIECFDISHFQGAQTVASMVSFLDGKARKSEYRKYKIETVEGVDDFASMREVVKRRYTRVLEAGLVLPDLIVIDGGKGQLSSAVEVLTELGLTAQPVIGLAKRLEEVFVPGESLPMNIPKTSPGLALLQRIRDEAHRFAITFHRARRSKATLQTELEEIDGVGPKRAKDLLEKLGSVRAVQGATVEAIADVIGWAAGKAVWEYFHDAENERQAQ
ncbi:MAG: excinuclease ABC subunit C [Ignavibacteria bacterium]|nr:excinuclease ABC subunit C [Ignavibacteria bacterium]